jgi:lysophospholipase L1-like esterase
MGVLGMKSLLGVVFIGYCATAQSPTCEEQVKTLEKEVELARHRLMDWAGLTHYGSEDTEIKPPTAGENRVVLLGDDITEGWSKDAPSFFTGKPYINRGIARQTTSQMLVRFQQDVVALKPKVVVIAGGSNDLAGMTGPATEVTIGQNLTSMIQIAKANGIKVVLASVTPVSNYYAPQTGRRPQGKIIGLNASIKRLAAQAGCVYLNYYSALADGRDLKKEFTADGLHPNELGYQAMAPLTEAAIAEALQQK